MSQASDTMNTPATESKADDTAMQAAMAKAKPARGKQAPKAVARTGTAQRNAGRETITLESAIRLGPTNDVVNKILKVFQVEPVPVAEIREMVEEHLAKQAEAMNMGEKGTQITLGRIVGAYVGAAHGAAQTYDGRRRTAREMTSKMNEYRDEDREGPSGFESRVEQAQEFAAMLAMQAVAAIAAAEGACSAYEHITGDIWKPYVPATPASAAIGRQAATARMSAFD